MIQTADKHAVLIYNEKERVWEEVGRYSSYAYAKCVKNLYDEKNWKTDIKMISRGIA